MVRCFVVLLAIMPLHTLYAQEPSSVLSTWGDEESIKLWGWGDPDGKMYDYKASREVIAKAPEWLPDKSDAPYLTLNLWITIQFWIELNYVKPTIAIFLRRDLLDHKSSKEEVTVFWEVVTCRLLCYVAHECTTWVMSLVDFIGRIASTVKQS